MPTISVIIPIYNVSEYLRRCLESVQFQTYKNLQVILVNDGSTDGSELIAQQFVDEDERFLLIYQENGGLSAARNTGLRLAKGDFVFYLDSDDYLKEDCLEKLIQAQEKYDGDVVQANFYYDYPDHLLYNDKLKGATIAIDQQVVVEGVIEQHEIKNFAWGKLIRRTIAQNHEFPKGLFFEDTLWKYRLIKEIKTYVLVGEPLLFYLQRGASISGNFSSKNLDQLKLYAQRLDLIKKQEPEFIYQKALKAFNQNIIQHERLAKQLNEQEQIEYLERINFYKTQYDLKNLSKDAYLKKEDTFWEKVKRRLFEESDYVRIKK